MTRKLCTNGPLATVVRVSDGRPPRRGAERASGGSGGSGGGGGSGGSGGGGGSGGSGGSSAAACVAPHLSCLRRCGFCRLARGSAPPSRPARTARAAHGLYRALALGATGLYLLQEVVYAYQERSDMEKFSRVMFLLLCHLTSIVKQVVFVCVDAERIDDLIAAFDDPQLSGGGRAADELRAHTARAARRLQRWYSGTALLTCTLWLVFPALSWARGQPVEFPFWSGLGPAPHRPSAPVFVAVLMYSYYVTSLVGIANTTMDAFMGTVLFQCKTQFTILRMNLEDLMERADEIKKNNGGDYDTIVMKLFVECLLHYKKICDMAALLQDIFSVAILVQFTISGWILCMAAYKMVSLNVLSVEFASMTLFMVCILTELFIYCYYGNEVTVESSRLVESLYAMRWVGAGRRLRAALVLTMERARRPLRPAAAGLVPLSLDTFLKILKSSYTFYAVLRQTK